jgi:hypothetical protein
MKMNLWVVVIEIVMMFLLLLVLALIVKSKNPVVRIEPGQLEARKNQVITVDLIIENVKNLATFQFDILFDASVVHVKSAKIGDFPGRTCRKMTAVGPDMNNRSNPGMLSFGRKSRGKKSGPEGYGVLASIEFIAWGEGTTKLELQNLRIRDIDGQELKAFTITNGEIKVSSGSDV